MKNSTVALGNTDADLNKFDPIKGIETQKPQVLQPLLDRVFKQIWPDQGDWNMLSPIKATWVGI